MSVFGLYCLVFNVRFELFFYVKAFVSYTGNESFER